MAKQYTQDQLEKIYETLPEELKETVFSVETARAISAVGERNDIEDERLNRIAEFTGYVLMGLILPQEFPQLLQEELKLKKPLAETIAREINRFVFYPVKPALEQLHRMEIEVTAKVTTPEPPSSEEDQTPSEKPQQKPSKEDTYREPIE